MPKRFLLQTFLNRHNRRPLLKAARNVKCVSRHLCFFCLIYLLMLPIAQAERLPLRIYTSADGMASSVINHLTRDSFGFLWFATRDGLIRFDGREFTNFRLNDSNASQTLFYVRETSDGSFWISAADGLYKLNRRETTEAVPDAIDKHGDAKQLLNAEKISDISFRVTYEDREGRVWGGANGLFLIRDAGGNVVLQQIDLGAAANVERGINIRDILHGRDGSLWIACNLGVIRKLPDGRTFYYPIHRGSSYDETKWLVEDAAGRIMVGHDTGLFILEPESLENLESAPDFSFRRLNLIEKAFNNQLSMISGAVVRPEKPGEMLHLSFSKFQTSSINGLFKASDGKIWLSVNHSLYFLEGDKFQGVIDERDSLPPIGLIAEDADANLWFGTTSGAIKYARQGMTTFDGADGLENPVVASVYQNSDGLLSVAHGDWRVSQLTGNKFESVKLKMPDSARLLWGSNIALPDRNGNWWALSEDGLYHFENLQNAPAQIYHQSDGLMGNSLFRGFCDSSGNLWFSTRLDENHTGLTRFDVQTRRFHSFTADEGYPLDRSPVSFAEDGAGNFWFGFYETGMARLRRETGRFDFFTAADGVPRGVISALNLDSKGRLWIGSSAEGLALIENPTIDKPIFAHLTTSEGLSSNNVRSLTEDLRGNIYAGTVRGVDRFNPQTGRIRHFSTADGLAGDYVAAAFRDQAGNLWFGTPNGVSKFVPEEDLPQNPPRVFVAGLNIAGTRYAVSAFGQPEINGIMVGAAQNNLQINYFAVGDSESLRYQYKLANTAEDWSQPSFERTVNFANLSPGSYQFLVRAVNVAGTTSENPAIVSFTIAPPFYRTWWFAALSVITAAGLIFALDRFRVRKTRQVENALFKSKESETRFRTLAETASDAIITINEASTIVFVNDAVEKIFGYAKSELIGEKLTILMPEALRPRHDAGLGRYAATNQKHISWAGIELPGRHKTGAEIPLELSFGDFEIGGKRYFTGIARDVSERRKAEEALRKSREERFTELEKVRTRIATDLHDDIGSSLTQIAVLTEVARGHSQLQTVKTPLERISAVSNELVEAMSDIVWAINPRKDNLRELVQRMRRFAADVFAARGIKFDFQAPVWETRLQLGANIRREVFAIFKECVNNIIKHSDATRATIDFEIFGDSLLLKISDDGRGFDSEQMLSADFTPEKGGNGLLNIRRRAAELGGKCEIISFAEGGTSVLLEIPLTIGGGGGDDGEAPTQTGGESGDGNGYSHDS